MTRPEKAFLRLLLRPYDREDYLLPPFARIERSGREGHEGTARARRFHGVLEGKEDMPRLPYLLDIKPLTSARPTDQYCKRHVYGR